MKEKIFISHHHEDASNLSLLKSYLKIFDKDCFLAHEDIEAGEYDLDSIEKHLKDCDVFLYISNENSNKSAFCQQEIGLAKGFGKEIISAMPAGHDPPQGFISRYQSIRYRGDIGDLCYQLLRKIGHKKKIGYLDSLRYLDSLQCKGFSLEKMTDTIYLEFNDGWNDYLYMTSFIIYVNNSVLGWVKIGYTGQEEKDTTAEYMKEYLPKKIPYLPDTFFSHFEPQNDIEPSQYKGLRYLLNDINVLEKESLQKIIEEPVLKLSLCRDRRDLYIGLKEKCEEEKRSSPKSSN